MRHLQYIALNSVYSILFLILRLSDKKTEWRAFQFVVFWVVLEVGNDVLLEHPIFTSKFHITPEFMCRLTRLHGVTTQ
jgi:hypothetical protein